VPMGMNAERLRQAAWVARCVGRAGQLPLRRPEIEALWQDFEVRHQAPGEPFHHAGAAPSLVCIVREGCGEFMVASHLRKVIIRALRSGDTDGDIQLLLEMPLPYEARASGPTTCLLIFPDHFARRLDDHPQIARRWMSSVAARLVRCYSRLTMLLGLPLRAQVAQLLLDEHHDGEVNFSQAALAAMLGPADRG
jgi:CRP-like cAMP-binding protein